MDTSCSKICDLCKKKIEDVFFMFEPGLAMSREEQEFHNFLRERYIFCKPCLEKNYKNGVYTIDLMKLIDKREDFK